MIALTCASEVIFKIGERSVVPLFSRVYTFNCDDGVSGKALYIKTFHSIMFLPATWEEFAGKIRHRNELIIC